MVGFKKRYKMLERTVDFPYSLAGVNVICRP